MQIDPFGLERWFAQYEHDADVMLAESGVRPLDAERFDTTPEDLGYATPTSGDPTLRAQIAERYDRTADEVLLTTGTQEANLLAFLTLLDEGDHAVVVTPTYQSLHALPETVGEVTRVPLEPPEWELDPDAVAEAIEPETTVVVLNNPNNPTGRYHDQATVETLYDLAADNGAYLLCDEVYRLLAEEPIKPVASMGRHGVSTTGLSKAWGLAGLRIGWLAGPPEVVQAAWNWKDYTSISPNVFGQHVAAQAFEQEAEILAENCDLVAQNRETVAAFLEEYGLEWVEPVGPNGFVTVPEGFYTGESFCRRVVEEEGVVLAPGGLFEHEEYFRIGFGLEPEALSVGLDRLGTFLDRHA